MNKYEETTSLILKRLEEIQVSQALLNANRKCFKALGEYLAEKHVDYSVAEADAWFDTISNNLKDLDKHYYRGALNRLSYVSRTGIMRDSGLSRKRNVLLCDSLNKFLEEFLDSEQGSKKERTVSLDRMQCRRFLKFVEAAGIHRIDDLSYEALSHYCTIFIDGAPFHRRRYGTIAQMLAYAYHKGRISYGLSIYLHYAAFNCTPFWDCVDAHTQSLIQNELTSAPVFPLSDVIDFQLHYQEILADNGYSSTHKIRNVRTIDLLILFLDFHSYSFSITIGELWYQRTRRYFNDRWDNVYRLLCMIDCYCRQKTIELRPLYRKPRQNSFRCLPEWCRDMAESYVECQKKEGKQRSTLDMTRSCLARFCNFMTEQGVRSYADITVDMIKRFNLQDHHETTKGKNAYNSRIRRFLIYLGTKGKLEDSNLYQALSCKSAPGETVVVVLTEDEKAELNREISGTDSHQSLRSKAILQLGLKMGLRASDIVNLTYDEIDWKAQSIHFTQQKTQVEVTLPMPTSVGNALYDYITRERPTNSNLSYIFLAEKAPFGKLTPLICQRTLKHALPDRHVKGSGFHVLRKTFATNSLQNGVGLDDVVSALGHSTNDNVQHYLSLDDERMTMCSLSLEKSGIRRWKQHE
jgi:site-specific recombinase XerD